jgi:hypothetical protein
VYPRLELAAVEGDRERAVTLLERYVAQGGRDYHWIDQSPIFAGLRQDSAFRAELDRLGDRIRVMRRQIQRELEGR